MRIRLLILSLVFLALALGLFVFSFHLYHHLSPEGLFTPEYRDVPAKPMITWLFSIWGVTFLFASVASFLSALILIPWKKAKDNALENKEITL